MFIDISVKLDRLEEKCTKNTPPIDAYDSADLQMFPIGQVCDVIKFEKDLNNMDYKKKVFGHLRRSTGCGMPWKTACYKLCATIFTKNVLTQFSWTGMSRSHEKQAFSKLTNILDLFYKLINGTDNSFSYPQRDIFFRDGVLKHSNTRLHGAKKTNLIEPSIETTVESQEDDHEENNIVSINEVKDG